MVKIIIRTHEFNIKFIIKYAHLWFMRVIPNDALHKTFFSNRHNSFAPFFSSYHIGSAITFSQTSNLSFVRLFAEKRNFSAEKTSHFSEEFSTFRVNNAAIVSIMCRFFLYISIVRCRIFINVWYYIFRICDIELGNLYESIVYVTSRCFFFILKWLMFLIVLNF